MIVSDWRFTMLYVYEEELQCCEYDIYWDFDYRFNKEMNKYGQ